MMDETEIDRVCRQDPYIKRYYIGTFAVDEVPRQLMPNTTFVVNLNRRQDSSMGHWVIGSSLPFSPSTQLERSFFYFDSFAKPPPKSIKEAISSLSPQNVYYNDIVVQNPISMSCGFVATYVLALLSRGYSPLEIILQHFYDFAKHPFKNEARIQPAITELHSLKKRPILPSNR